MREYVTVYLVQTAELTHSRFVLVRGTGSRGGLIFGLMGIEDKAQLSKKNDKAQ